MEMDIKDKKLFLLDMDGTIYLDDRLFDGVGDFLEKVRENGGRYIFMTNNSSKSASDYIAKLATMGIKAGERDFVTSADAVTDGLTEIYGSPSSAGKIYLIGTGSFAAQLVKDGFTITDQPEEDVDILLCGFDRELTYKKLEDGCRLLLSKRGRSIGFFASNPDLVCPVECGYVPDCGSICGMIETATGRKPLYFGKPAPRMAEMAMQRTGFSREETLLIGDRLYTDIACGVNAKIDSCFVLSGEGTLKDLETSRWQPAIVAEDIRVLLSRM